MQERNACATGIFFVIVIIFYIFLFFTESFSKMLFGCRAVVDCAQIQSELIEKAAASGREKLEHERERNRIVREKRQRERVRSVWLLRVGGAGTSAL